MITNNRTKKFFSVFIVIIVLVAILLLYPWYVSPKNIIYTSNDKEYYSDDFTFSDDGIATTETEIFSYTSKQTTIKQINNTFPAYYNNNNTLSNACANVAGANIFGYYDRYYENLIPDYTPGMIRGSGYTYYSMTVNMDKKQNLINDLYVRMSTNNPIPGTSQLQYKNGITSYANSKSLNTTFTSVMSNNSLDMNKVTDAIDRNEPISLYLSGYNFSQLMDADGNVTITKYILTGNHIVIVYGYRIVNYYNVSNILIKSKTYLYVATGMLLYSGFYILNNNGTINDAEAIKLNEV